MGGNLGTGAVQMGMRKDWRARLGGYLAAEARTPFEYGTSDCALFAAGALYAMTGSDPSADYRGRYTSLRGGLRILRKDGFRDHVERAAALLTEEAPQRTRVGDIAVVETSEGPSLGVVQGEWIAVRTLSGLGFVPADQATRVFRP
jgi:hypothetical protein